MKKLIILFVSAIIFAGCSKNKNSKPDDGNKPPVETPADTLLTLNLANDDFQFYSSTYFVVTDENGEILNEIKYVNGTASLKITSLKPYKKERFNFFEINISADTTITKSVIKSYLQVKKGSHYYDMSKRLLSKPAHELKYHLKNLRYFTLLDIRGDQYGYSLKSPGDTIMKLYPAVTDDGKLYVHLQANYSDLYQFFYVDKGATDIDINMMQINNMPLEKTITSTGTNLSVEILARPDKSYYSNYSFGAITSASNQVNYYYPSEHFAEYITKTTYKLGNFNYYFTKNTSTIPDKTDTYDAVINTSASNLATFKPTFSGPVDYYAGYFESEKSGPGFNMQLFSPTAANYTSIKLPDFSKYLGAKSVDLSKETLISFALFKDGTFDETSFPYKTNGNAAYPNLNLKSISRSFRP